MYRPIMALAIPACILPAILLLAPTSDGVAPDIPYGMASITHMDAEGKMLGSYSVHNRLIDEGEDWIVGGLFNAGGQSASLTPLRAIGEYLHDKRFNSLCLGPPDFNNRENASMEDFVTAAPFNMRNSCVVDENLSYTNGTGVISIHGRWIGGQNAEIGAEAGSITVCNENRNTRHCGVEGSVRFAVVEITPVTFSDGDVLDVEYVFDVSTPDS
ncbi:hypothetical protein CENSYa_1750 [Cenarchaeum symbiosum A]|uniref:Uncharacterized protein n=1 Tax=Cenarchaeum symbiosum (strain A) TaxID=414004 RepID=A0RYE4_CENSY|nr:hypothetical protein CENSYa_1750 [Cenarchaeum symbiosum A]